MEVHIKKKKKAEEEAGKSDQPSLGGHTPSVLKTQWVTKVCLFNLRGVPAGLEDVLEGWLLQNLVISCPFLGPHLCQGLNKGSRIYTYPAYLIFTSVTSQVLLPRGRISLRKDFVQDPGAWKLLS